MWMVVSRAWEAGIVMSECGFSATSYSSCVLKLQIASLFLKHSVKWCSRFGLECSMKDQMSSGWKKQKSLWCSCKALVRDARTRKLAWRYTACVVVGKGDGWARAELSMGRDALKSSWGTVMAVLCAVQALIFCKESLLCHRHFFTIFVYGKEQPFQWQVMQWPCWKLFLILSARDCAGWNCW